MSTKEFKRGPNKIQKPHTLQSMYTHYIEQFDEDSPYHIPYSRYKEITVFFLQYLRDQIVEKSFETKLPFNLGHVSVVKRRRIYKSIDSMPVDWKASKEAGKKVRFFNTHSSGYSYSFFWSKKYCSVKNKNNYLFKPTRANSRRVAELVKNKENDYFELTSRTRKITERDDS